MADDGQYDGNERADRFQHSEHRLRKVQDSQRQFEDDTSQNNAGNDNPPADALAVGIRQPHPREPEKQSTARKRRQVDAAKRIQHIHQECTSQRRQENRPKQETLSHNAKDFGAKLRRISETAKQFRSNCQSVKRLNNNKLQLLLVYSTPILKI